jgi:hypothetical protein
MKNIYVSIQKIIEEDGTESHVKTRYFHNLNKALKVQKEGTGWRGCVSRSYFVVDLYEMTILKKIKGKIPSKKQYKEFMAGFKKLKTWQEQSKYGWDIKY